MIRQNEKGQPYVLGSAISELHLKYEQQNPGILKIKKIVSSLADKIHEYIILAELRDSRLIPLVEIDSDQELIVTRPYAEPQQLHTMASAKVLMAYLSETQQRMIIRSTGLKYYGSASITDEEVLIQQLTEIRKKKCAVIKNESSDGVCAIAVPVADRTGAFTRALGTHLPLVRASQENEKLILSKLNVAAAAIHDCG